MRLSYKRLIPLSYTHLDVYKRQVQDGSVACCFLGDPVRQALDGGASLVSAGRVTLEAVALRLILKF